ncbi:hypothetical protein ScPMuIL_001046 [Solemya velum]
MRWLSKIDNGAADAKDKVISMLRRCAHAVSVEDYQTALSSLQGSTEWVSNGRLRQWFSRTWIPEYKRWVWAYRFGFGLLVNTNNGLERQNKVFKYTYLEEKKNNSLSAMVKILITDYLPAMMLKYVRDNAVSSENFGRRYQTCIPNFLRSRPPIFLKHCMQKMEAALMIDHVKKVEETDSCYQSPDVTWDKVARPYMDSPFFTLDMEVVNIPVSGLRVEIGEDLDGDKEMKLPSPKHGPEMKVKKKKVRFSGTQQDGPSIVVLEDKKRESVRIGPPSTVLDSSESKVNIYESCKSPVGDCYGTTKQVRIIQLYGVSTLQNACRDLILQIVQKENITQLPLPKKLKQFLRYEL